MPLARPSTNPIGSLKEFRALCVSLLKEHTYRMSPAAMRHLRSTLALRDETFATVREALVVLFGGLEGLGTKRVCIPQLCGWLLAEREAGSAPRALSEPSCGDMHFVRKVLDRKVEAGVTYFLVDWEPTWEPRSNVNAAVIATFKEERRALVRRTYIDDEAIEDNTVEH